MHIHLIAQMPIRAILNGDCDRLKRVFIERGGTKISTEVRDSEFHGMKYDERIIDPLCFADVQPGFQISHLVVQCCKISDRKKYELLQASAAFVASHAQCTFE